MRGTVEEAANYCKKDGEFTEIGILPKCRVSVDKFKKAIELAEKGNLTEVKECLPGIYLRYKATLESIVRYDRGELENSCGIWISGPPRSGKDYAVKQVSDLYVKPLNKWWCGYNGGKKYVNI